jgi:hypothetical protein
MPTTFLRTAAALMLLLGAVRGFGGILLLFRGPDLDPDILAGPIAARVIGVGLIVVAALEIVASIGAFRRRRAAWRLGIAATLLFVVDGLVNGAVLYGRPGDAGTTVNVVAAVLILGTLLAGRRALAD